MTNLVKTLTLNTVNGKVTAELPYKNSVLISYKYKISCNDTNNKKVVTTCHNAYEYDGNYSNNITEYRLTADKTEYSVGDTVELKIKNYSNTTEQNGKAILIYLQKGVIKKEVINGTKSSYVFKESDVPETMIGGSFFIDGKIYTLRSVNIRFKKSDKELKTNIIADKNDYKPGETVNLILKTTDKNGIEKPSVLNLSVCNEAVFLMREQNPNPLNSLYSQNGNFFKDEYSSYKQMDYEYNLYGDGSASTSGSVNNSDTSAKSFDKSNDGIRNNFMDTAYFMTVTTDANGNGKISFTLPDNITKWRITAHAISNDNFTGFSEYKINATLPFVAEILMENIIKKSDDCIVSARAVSKILNSKTATEFTATIKGKNIDKTKTISGKTTIYTDINFGRLPVGNYTVTLKAVSGSYSDALSMPLEVAESLLETRTTKVIDLTSNTKIIADIRKSPVNVYVYDKDAEFYMNCINKIFDYRGARVDQVVSENIANAILSKYQSNSYENYYTSNKKSDIVSKYQNDKLIALLNYSTPSLPLTAKLMAVAPEFFNTDIIKTGFYTIIENTNSTISDKLIAYFGLASLKCPILDEFDSFANQSIEFTDEQNIYIALTHAYSGNFDKTKKIWNEKVLPNLIYEKSAVHYNNENNEELTGLVSLLSIRLGMPETLALIEYINAHTPENDLLSLQLAAFLKDQVPVLSGESKVKITIKGEEKTEIFKTFDTLVYKMTKEDFDKAIFEEIEGNAIVAVNYVGPLEEMMKNQKKTVNVTSAINAKSIKKGDTVNFNISFKTNSEPLKNSATIIVVLPAGLKYLDYSQNANCYLSKKEDQQLEFTIWANKDINEFSLDIKCQAKLSGKFTMEEAVVTDNEKKNYGISKKFEIEITD